MPIILPPTIKAEVERPQQQNPQLWLVEITVDRGAVGVPPSVLRLCDGGEQITWPFRAATSGYLANGAASLGATAVAIDSGTGAIAPLDTLTFGNHATTYTVVAYAAGILTLNPALTSAVPDNTALTIVATTATWYPFPFDFSPIEQSNEGDQSSIDLSIDNSVRTLMKLLHEGNGCEGNPVRLFLVPKNGLTLPYPSHEAIGPIKAVVAAASATDEVVTFRLSMPNFFNVTSPSDRYTGARCRWDYGSSFCGYVLNGFAAFPTCPKTIEACTERGLDMVARGLPAVLPGNFGGHPGIARRRA